MSALILFTLSVLLVLFCVSSIIGLGWILLSLFFPFLPMLVCSIIGIGIYCILFAVAFYLLMKNAMTGEKEEERED